MWALTYDYMISYSMKDMSPEPALATAWETSDDGLTWTFDIRDGVKWSDGEPLTAADIAYTYNRMLDGGLEGADWGSYLTNVTTVTAPDDTTVVLDAVEAERRAAAAADPDRARAHLEGRRPRRRSRPTRPSRPTASRSSAPARSGSSRAPPADRRTASRPTPTTGAATPHIDEVVFRVYKSDDPAVQALIKGEVDFVHDITPLQVGALEDEPGHHRAERRLADLRRDRASTPERSTPRPVNRSATGTRRCTDPKFRHALGCALDHDKIVENRLPGRRTAGATVVPAAYSNYHWDPPDDVPFSFDLDKAAEVLDEAGYTLGSDGKRTMPDGSPIGTLRLFARSEQKSSVDTMDFFQGWLGDLGIDSEVTAIDSDSLGDLILDGTTTPSSGTGTSSLTRTASSPTSPATSAVGSPTRGTATRATTRCTSRRTARPMRRSGPRS